MGKQLEKREKNPLVGENAQYALALGVIGVMLYVVGLPAFVIFFLGAFSFFLWKLFSSGSASETRKIFEFYLAANEILRSDDRRWYGFEIQDAIARGEKILKNMATAPPLLHFALGALYHKKGAFTSAIKHLEYVIEDGGSNEAAIVFPTNELRDYVRVLRKIEREPADAPQTSAAIRSLERIRKNKGITILDDARHRVHDEGYKQLPEIPEIKDKETQRFVFFQDGYESRGESEQVQPKKRSAVSRHADNDVKHTDRESKHENTPMLTDRKPISELLQDIYDDKVQ